MTATALKPMATEPRCELTDLFTSSCACKKHRNSPELPADRGHAYAESRAITKSDYMWANQFPARYASQCFICEGDIAIGDPIYPLLPPDTPVTMTWIAKAMGYGCEPCHEELASP